MRVGEGLLVVLGQSLVEFGVLVILNLGGGPEPDGLVIVDVLPVPDGLLNLLGRGEFLLVLVFDLVVLVVGGLVVLVGLFHVLLLLFLSLGGLLGEFLVAERHLLLDLLAVPEVDGEVDKLGVLLDEFLELVLLEVLLGLLLEVDVDLDAAAEGFALVLGDCERAVRLGLPDPLLILGVVLGADLDEIGDEVDGVEADAELSDEVHVAALLHLLEECGGTGLGDGAQVFLELRLGHAHAAIADGQHAVLLIDLDPDVEVGVVAGPENGLVGEGEESDLIEGVASVGDELAKEDVLVGVQRVDDDVHQARDLGLELGHLGAGLERLVLVSDESRPVVKVVAPFVSRGRSWKFLRRFFCARG